MKKLLALLFIISFFSQPSLAQQMRSAKFEKTFMTFDLTFNNPSNNSIEVVKVGIRSDVALGIFQCSGASEALIPLANYLVKFHVSDKETIIDADPIITIAPKESARFTISIIPDAIGACGYWASNVSAIVIFSDGSKIYSSPCMITQDEVDAFSQHIPSDNEVLAALKHRNASLRIQAINDLPLTNIDHATINKILKAKLKDKNAAVRRAAALQAGRCPFKEVTKDIDSEIINLMELSGDESEITDYCKALGMLKSAKAIQPIVDQIDKWNYVFCFTAGDALLNIGHPDVPAAVRQHLKSRLAWVSKDVGNAGLSYGNNKKISTMLEVLIAYQDVQSINLIREFLHKSKYDYIIWNCLSELVKLGNQNHITTNPFLLSMKNDYLILLSHRSGQVRLCALDLICMTNDEDNIIVQSLQVSLDDPEVSVRACAAKWIGRLRLKQFEESLVNWDEKAKTNEEKNTYEEALRILNK